LSLQLVKAIRLIEEFRKLDSEMQAQTMMTLLYIAQRNSQGIPVTVKEVGDFLGITSASASRNVAALSKFSRHNKAGHDLITTYENPERRIEKFIELTAKGKRVISTIEEYFNVNNQEGSELASIRSGKR
jgi:DNA-binding MarR family transcriptional regulator